MARFAIAAAHDSSTTVVTSARLGRGDGYGGSSRQGRRTGRRLPDRLQLTGDVRLSRRGAGRRPGARHQCAGRRNASPWPFRVVAETGVAREEYSPRGRRARVVRHARTAQLGDVAAWKRARAVAWNGRWRTRCRTIAGPTTSKSVPPSEHGNVTIQRRRAGAAICSSIRARPRMADPRRAPAGVMNARSAPTRRVSAGPMGRHRDWGAGRVHLQDGQPHRPLRAAQACGRSAPATPQHATRPIARSLASYMTTPAVSSASPRSKTAGSATAMPTTCDFPGRPGCRAGGRPRPRGSSAAVDLGDPVGRLRAGQPRYRAYDATGTRAARRPSHRRRSPWTVCRRERAARTGRNELELRRATAAPRASGRRPRGGGAMKWHGRSGAVALGDLGPRSRARRSRQRSRRRFGRSSASSACCSSAAERVHRHRLQRGGSQPPRDMIAPSRCPPATSL